MEIQEKIIFEEHLDPSFLGEVKEASKCDDIDRCIQCGTCSSSCPSADYMDYSPRQTIAPTARAAGAAAPAMAVEPRCEY